MTFAVVRVDVFQCQRDSSCLLCHTLIVSVLKLMRDLSPSEVDFADLIVRLHRFDRSFANDRAFRQHRYDLRDLLHKIHETGASGVVIDLTSVDVIDSFIAKVLGDVIGMSKLMGAKVVLTGIQPAVAITLIELGIHLADVQTALDLEKGLETLQQELGE